MASKCSNFEPLARAGKVPAEKKVAIVPPAAPQNTAGIDFGTSSCSLAFSVSSSEKVVNLPFGRNFEEREMTAILLERLADRKVIVKSFGKSAQNQFSRLGQSDIEKHIYFECFKMELRKDVKLKTLVQDDKGRQHYLVEVIAVVLKHLKDKFHKYLETAPFQKDKRHLLCTDFDWIITVPAIWSAASKQMMRRAAQKAGLCSTKYEGIDFLSAPGEFLDATFENVKPVKIVLEPECAGIYCQNMTANMKAPFCNDDPLDGQNHDQGTSRYMVIDIGGGTVDISIHQFGSDDRIDSVTPPIGNEFGGTEINKKFAKLLSSIVKDDDFTSFKKKKATAKGALSDMIYSTFEDEKRRFGALGYKKDEVEKIFMPLHIRFLRFYPESTIINGIAALNDNRIVFTNGDTIEIEFSYFLELIEDILKGIWECTATAIRQANCQIDTIYLVGGFGGTRLIFEMLKEKFAESFPRLKPPCFMVPLKHDLAVSEGAVLYARNPSKIRSRVSDAHYGIGCNIPFNPSKHKPHYMTTDEDKKKMCHSVFLLFVEKGQIISECDIFTEVLIPQTSSQRTVKFNFYSTRDNCHYILNEAGHRNVQLLGTINISIPESSMQALPRKKRETKVEMIFFDTEIQAKGTYLPTGKEIEIELDFLSNI